MKMPIIAEPDSSAEEIYNVIAENCEFYNDQNGNPFLVFYNSNMYNLYYLSSKALVLSFIRRMVFNTFNRAVKRTDVQTAFDTICANAETVTKEIPVATRIYEVNDIVYYNLKNFNGDVVKITKDKPSVVSLKKVNSVFFKDLPSAREQKKPRLNSKYGVFDFIREFTNVPKHQELLLAVYVCAAFLPDIPHPIIIADGEKGSGKTTFVRLLGKLIYPSNNDVFVLPDRTENLITTLSNNYFVAFDNLGKLSPEVLNIFCQVSTGGTLTKRQLFTDNSEISINIKRLLALNGIGLEISQGDLLDRSIVLNLLRIDEAQRKSEQEIFNTFNQRVPFILGDVFSILSRAIAIYPTLKLKKLPRMADFCRWGYAIAEAIKQGLGEKFVAEYKANEDITTELSVQENPLLESIRHFAEKEGTWKGTPTELLKNLHNSYRAVYISKPIPSSFPQTANILSRKIKNVSHELSKLNIDVEMGRGSNRYIKITKLNNNSSADNDDVDDTDESNSNREILLSSEKN